MAIAARLRRGERLVLTYRGQPVMRLEPLDEEVSSDDPFYRLSQLADSSGETVSNEAIDEIVYDS
jgi:antitoxin (DNA-binding transcriptional repressor) of toxin-antitoxin stability system